MQQPANQAPLGMFVPGQQAFAQGNQAMPPFPAAPPACGLYSSGCQAMQPQQQGALARQQQQQQPLNAGTGSAGARNPFAAMPRELRNNQLRSNLAAVAGAFSSCSGGAAGPRGASPPASAARSSMAPPPQHQQWATPAMHSTGGSPLAAAGAAAAGLATPPGMYLAASSGMEVAPAALPVSLGSAGSSYSAGLTQGYSTMPAPYSSGAYTSPLPPPMHSSYLQQQQMMACQQSSMHAGFYSDPLPYLPNVSLPAMALPAGQQQQQLFASQGLPASMPCSMPLMEPAGMGYPAAAGCQGLSEAQLLLQKQQALQQLQAVEQMLLLRLLPDV
uniref:Uncharacterized protein n=1 Tax=Tetradesmus obliquus TaxID=3088 RepID=A0A383WKK2_TETOB|eukprot:jgi/Sobl393_1/8410/SZX77990.1